MKKSDIKAVVSYDWNRKDNQGCKFIPGEKAKVSWGYTGTQNARKGQVGTVFAVTVAGDNGKIRGHNTFYGRAYTRYYVEFNDGNVQYFEAHHLIKA